jgi:signal transduction histidine kinase
MKLSLRAKSMLWLLALIGVIYFLLGTGLYVFNLHERREHPDEVAEETEELLIIYGIMAGALPLAAFVAWRVSDQILRPLQSILKTAQEIRQGGLDQRIETPVATDELGQLALALNEAFENYRRLLERTDRFSLDAAHQLRNPLASIRTSGEICLQKDRSPAEYQDVIAGMVEDSIRLSHTVDQLLLLARLAREDVSFPFEPVDLSALARELAENLRPAFETAQVHLSVVMPDSPLLIRGAPRLLEQAIANLLDNALRFTPANGKVLMELQKNKAGRITLAVSDTGPGLSQPAPAKTDGSSPNFNPRPKEGAGLGLLIVSNVLRAHGGALHATVGPLGGAEFTLEFPPTE